MGLEDGELSDEEYKYAKSIAKKIHDAATAIGTGIDSEWIDVRVNLTDEEKKFLGWDESFDRWGKLNR